MMNVEEKNNKFSGKCFNLQSWSIYNKDDLFESVVIDDKISYLFKEHSVLWYTDYILKSIYHHKLNHVRFMINFRNKSIPDRCKEALNSLHSEFIQYLYQNGRSRVDKSKAKVAVKIVLKNISRLKFHKRYSLVYNRDQKFWKDLPVNISHTFILECINFLTSKGVVRSFTGFVSPDGENISSMLLVLPEFIDECNGFTKSLIIDDCLKQVIPKELCVIRKRISKNKYVSVKPLSEEEELFKQETDIMFDYYKTLEGSYIEIGGVCIPEIFFTRIHNESIYLTGRCYDDGQIQGQSKEVRATITIDGETTVELDYGSLHYSMAAEELGINLNGKDPYNFIFSLDVNYVEVSEHRNKYGLKSYDPIRNLKKLALLVMFNSDSKSTCIRAISKAILEDKKKKNGWTKRFVGLENIPVTKLVDAMIEYNKEVSDYFNTGVGLKFQNLDSKMIQYCIEDFVKIGEVLLPVHDSIIVKKSLEEYSKTLMYKAYEYVMGTTINCKVS